MATSKIPSLQGINSLSYSLDGTYYSGTLTIHKTGYVVNVKGVVQVTTPSTSNITVGVSYAPVEGLFYSVGAKMFSAETGTPLRATVTATGSIMLQHGTANSYYQVDITYFSIA